MPVHTGDVRVDVAGGAGHARARSGAYRPLLDISDGRPATSSARACGDGAVVRRPVGPRRRPAGGAADARSTRCTTIVERFMTRWRGEPDPQHVKAVDAYFVSAAEHGMNASTFTRARDRLHRRRRRGLRSPARIGAM